MLTKNKIQSIRDLHERSGRHESGLFLVEWRKGIMEFIGSDFEVVEGFFTEELLTLFSSWGTKDLSKDGADSSQARNNKTKNIDTFQFPHCIISEKELERISTLSSNRDGLLVVRMRRQGTGFLYPKGTSFGAPAQEWEKQSKLTLILDGINDPGNLGTIIRIADWYGISRIICSLDTVDCYNPKVLMATMGSFTRVHVEYREIEEYLSQLKNQKIYGAYLDGESTHAKKFEPAWWYLVIGSESHGIRSHLERYITDKITIPRFGLAESLNAGVATAVILDRMSGI